MDLIIFSKPLNDTNINDNKTLISETPIEVLEQNEPVKIYNKNHKYNYNSNKNITISAW